MKVKVAKLVLAGLMATASVVLFALTGFSVMTSTPDTASAEKMTLEQQVALQVEEFETPIDPDVFVEVGEPDEQGPYVAALFILPASVCGPPLIEVDAYAQLLQKRDIGVHTQAVFVGESKSQAERYIRLADLRMPARAFGRTQEKIEVDGSYIVFVDISSYTSTYRVPLFKGKTTEEYKNVVLDLVFAHHMSGRFS